MPLITILVEDSKTIRDSLMAAMAELSEVEVVATAETPSEAAAAFEEFKDSWRLAVVDLFLKEGSGLSILRACQERPAGRHVVILTNYATPDIRRRCVALGADAVFDKSTELEAFFELCNAYARGHKQP
ncbi:response regulator [Variovorax sp. J22R133]|uniref:response regulator n=1 Tax=Variovorax brevis TaxID=3053503 RepID=UPI002578C5D9|nr:response regulator [Variovorax sp. J22R133]MDM0114854.1 response regulator [Variovorax sp. J22R133]